MNKILAFGVGILMIVFFVYNNAQTSATSFEYEGLIMPKNSIEEILKEKSQYGKAELISLVQVDFGDELEEKNNDYFVGKQAVDPSYPLLTRGESALNFMTGGAYLIGEDFSVTPVLEGMTVSGQLAFNPDGQQADAVNNNFVQFTNDLHMGIVPVEISTVLETTNTKPYSYFYFDENYVNVLSYSNGELEYKAIRGMVSATITINGKTYKYSEFYDMLNESRQAVSNMIKDNNNTVSEILELSQANTNNSSGNTGNEDGDANSEIEDGEGQSGQSSGNPGENGEQPGGNASNTGNGNQGNADNTGNNPESGGEGDKGSNNDQSENPGDPGDPVPAEYIKPEVTLNNMIPWTYSSNVDVDIYDPRARIIRGINFYVYDETGRLILRKQLTESGNYNLSTLPPDTKLYIKGTVEYYNEYSAKVTDTFLETTEFTTEDLSLVSPVKMTYSESEELKSSNFALDNISISNISDYDSEDTSLENFYKDTLPYVNKVVILLTDENNETTELFISGPSLAECKEGSFDYISQAVLRSNTKYEVDMYLEDRYMNKIPVEIEELDKYITSKQEPTVDFTITDTKTNNFSFIANLNDKDTAIVDEEYTIQILDASNQPMELKYLMDGIEYEGDTININKANVSAGIKVTNLPFSQLLTLVATSSYDTENNLGLQKDVKMGETQFYSAAISSGTLQYTNSFQNVAGTYMNMAIELNRNTTAAVGLLLTDLEIIMSSEGNEDIVYNINKDEINNIDVETNYDEDEQKLIIREGDPTTKEPEVSLVGAKEIFQQENKTIWDTFLDGMYSTTVGTTPSQLNINLYENTLNPSTYYEVEVNSYAIQGVYTYDLPTKISRDNFTTKKREPQVQYSDFFMAKDFVEIYDVFVTDVDGTIIEGDYNIELKDGDTVIQSIPCKTNETVDLVKLEDLVDGREYEINFKAILYNDGPTAGTQVSNQIFKTFKIKGGEGISADIAIDTMSYEYGNNGLNEGQLVDGITEGATYDTSKKEVVENEEYFLTDFLPFEANGDKNYIISNFAAQPQNVVGVYCFNDEGTYVTAFTCYGTDTISEERFSTIFENEKITQIRIRGIAGNEETAGFAEFDPKESEKVYDHDTSEGKTEDRTISDVGNETYSSGYYLSEEIEVSPGEIYNFSGVDTDYLRVCFYDEKGMFIKYQTIYYSAYDTILPPEKAETMRFSYKAPSEGTDVCMYRINSQKKDTMKANVNYEITDNGEYIKEGDKYVLIQSKAEDLKTYNYEVFNEENNDFTFNEKGEADVSGKFSDSLPKNQAFKYEIVIDYNGRTIVLDTLLFETTVKYTTISSCLDLKKIEDNPTGYFIFTKDIEETSNQLYNVKFRGILDLQGYTYTPGKNGWREFEYISQEAGVINGKIDLTNIGRGYFTYSNHGLIDNIVFEMPETLTIAPIINNQTRGTISNFIVEYNGEHNIITGSGDGGLIYANYGEVVNGIVYNSVENGHIYVTKSEDTNVAFAGSTLVNYNTNRGTIKNVLSLVDIYGEDTQVGVIAGLNYGYIENCISQGDRYGYYWEDDKAISTGPNLTQDAMVGEKSTSNVTYPTLYKNLYYNSDFDNYTKEFATYTDKRLLHDEDWYYKSIGKTDGFSIDSLVSQGYYPRLELNSYANKYQPYIELPSAYDGIDPELLDSYVVEEKDDTATVVLKMRNPSNVTITEIGIEDDNLDTVIMAQEFVGDFYEVTILLSNPKKFVSEYTVDEVKYRTSSGNRVFKADYAMEVEFYDTILSLYDWNKLVSNPDSNFKLKADIDFSSVSNMNTMYVGSDFTGKLDGGKYDEEGNLIGTYSIKNLDLDEHTYYTKSAVLFQKVSTGTIKNITFDNIKYNKETRAYNGIIYSAYGAIFDNIHLKNIEMSSYTYSGSLLAHSYRSIITNCSATNITMSSNEYNSAAYIGGLIGYSDTDTISNCYVQGLKISNFSGNNQRSGGLISTSSNSKIENIYVTGVIDGETNIGGLVGSSTIDVSNSYTNVEINGTGDYLGGISGKASFAQVKNTFVAGNINTLYTDSSFVHRVMGMSAPLGNENYAAETQLIKTKNVGIDDTDKLLSYGELVDPDTYEYEIKLGDSFDYASVSSGALPLLKDTNGNIMPNQELIYLQPDSLEVTTQSATVNGNELKVTLLVSHDLLDIMDIKIDGLDINKIEYIESSASNSTTCNITATKINAFDAYEAVVSLGNKETGVTNFTLKSKVVFDELICWEINDINDWQSIMQNHKDDRENFKITGTVDFSKVDPSYLILDINAGKIIGTDDGKLINLGTENNPFYDNNYKNIFKTVWGGIENVEFENIHMIYNNNTTYLGVIGVNYAKSSNLSFDNVSIKYTLSGMKPMYVGVIGAQLASIEDVELNNINVDVYYNGINTSGKIGGLTGYSTSQVDNITATNISVLAEESYYVGGIVGDVYNIDPDSTTMVHNNIKLENANVAGWYYTGGIIGHGDDIIDIYNPIIKDVTVKGDQYVGGMCGYGDWIIVKQENPDVITMENIVLEGRTRVHGILHNGSAYNIIANNIDVTATESIAGGFLSYGGLYDSIITDSTIRAPKYAGVMGGYSLTAERTRAIDCHVIGEEYVGGIVGASGNINSDMEVIIDHNKYINYNSILNTTVTGENYVGGLIGYNNNYYSGIHANNLHDMSIIGENFVGGVVGYGEPAYCNFKGNYIEGSNISCSKDYVGGLMGGLSYENATNYFYITSSYTYNNEINGVDSVGGLFGTVRDLSSMEYPYSFIKLVSNSNIVGTSNVDPIGNFKDGDLFPEDTVYDVQVVKEMTDVNGTLSQGTTINGEDVSEEQVGIANSKLVTPNEIVMPIDYMSEEISSYASFNEFSVVPTDLDTGEVTFYEVDLPDGTYKVGVSYYNSNTVYGFADELIIKDGTGTVVISDLAGRHLHTNFRIYEDSDEITKTTFTSHTALTSSIFTNYYGNYNTIPTTVKVGDNSVDGYYVYSDTILQEPVTISIGDIPDGATAINWRRSYDERGYNYSYNTIWTLSDDESENDLIINAPGVYHLQYYYEGTYYLTPPVIVETPKMYPQVTTVTYQTNILFQNGYTIDETTGIPIETRESLRDMPGGIYLAMPNRDEKPVAVAEALYSSSMASSTVPSAEMYSSGINTVNLEFDDSVAYNQSNSNTTATVKIGDDEETYDVNSRVMSLQYDYMEDIEVTVDNGKDEKTTVFEKEDLRKTVSAIDDKQYYITEDGVEGIGETNENNDNGISVEEEDSIGGIFNIFASKVYASDENDNKDIEYFQGDYIHIYENYGLMSDGTIYDFESGTIASEGYSNNTLMEESIPLYVGEYDGNEIATYKSFSIVNGDESLRENPMYVKDDTLFMLNGNQPTDNEDILIDTYNDSNFIAVISGGKLVNVQDSTNADDFTNANIAELSTNINSSLDSVLIRYDDGSVTSLNYVTGSTTYIQAASNDISIFDYATTAISNFFGQFSKVESTDTGYTKTIEAIASFESLDAVEMLGFEESEYITMYNADTGNYDVYAVNDILSDLPDDEIKSMEEKIKVAQAEGVALDVDSLSNRASKGMGNINRLIVYTFAIIIIITIGALLILLRRRKSRK